MEDRFKNHKVLFTIHPYGHGMPCPCNAKQTQSPPGPRPKCAKRTQFPHTAGVSPHTRTPKYTKRTQFTPRPPSADPKIRNEPNFAPPPARQPHHSQLCKTNPIPRDFEFRSFPFRICLGFHPAAPPPPSRPGRFPKVKNHLAILARWM